MRKVHNDLPPASMTAAEDNPNMAINIHQVKGLPTLVSRELGTARIVCRHDTDRNQDRMILDTSRHSTLTIEHRRDRLRNPVPMTLISLATTVDRLVEIHDLAPAEDLPEGREMADLADQDGWAAQAWRRDWAAQVSAAHQVVELDGELDVVRVLLHQPTHQHHLRSHRALVRRRLPKWVFRRSRKRAIV
jgi:hypothetical protein